MFYNMLRSVLFKKKGLIVLNNPNAYGTPADDYFGVSVAIDGNNAIVGVPDEDDSGGSASGKAYIFNVTTGALVHTLSNPNVSGTSNLDNFGASVGISGNYAVVGTPSEDSPNGNSGVAYIFNVITGALIYTLYNPNAYDSASSDAFGSSVAISGDYAVVNASGEDINGVMNGVSYIFNVTTGLLHRTLSNPNIDGSYENSFGRSIAISNNYVIAGAPIETDELDNISGKAYIFNMHS